MSKLVKDWFGRRAEEAYTFNDESKRLFNWDKGRDSYSSYFMNDDKNALKNAAKMVGSMVRVVGVPKNFGFTHETKMQHHNKVQVPIAMLKDEDGAYRDNDPKMLDAFYGATIQNAALAAMQTTAEYRKTLQARDTNRSTSVRDLMFSILNTERIDKKLADRLPGYLKFVQRYKDYTYDKIEERDATSILSGPAPAQKRLMDLIVKLLRYPANLDEDDLKEFEKPVQSIERLIKRYGGIPATADECDALAGSLAQIIYKYKEEEEEPPPGSGGEGDGEGEGELPPGSGSGKSEEGEEEKEGSKSLSKKELDDMAKGMMENIVNPEEDGDASEMAAELDEFTEDMNPESSVDFDWDKEGSAFSEKVEFVKAEPNKTIYQHTLKDIDVTKAAVLQTLFKRKSKDQAFVMKSMRSGRLDTNKIAEASQNVPTIYERMGHIKTDKICVGVLIDESGSMGGTKIKKAREAAIFINEVFKKMRDVDFYVYGHTADEGRAETKIRVYREKGANINPFALGSVEAHSNNRDGDAILACAMRIRKKTENQGILFVLSDGAPAAYNYTGKAAIEDTRKKVQKAQSLGFQVIQIAIESHVPSEQMFDHFIKMTNIKDLPRDMAGYMSRKVDKLIRERVSL